MLWPLSPGVVLIAVAMILIRWMAFSPELATDQPPDKRLTKSMCLVASCLPQCKYRGWEFAGFGKDKEGYTVTNTRHKDEERRFARKGDRK